MLCEVGWIRYEATMNQADPDTIALAPRLKLAQYEFGAALCSIATLSCGRSGVLVLLWRTNAVL